MPNPGTLGLQSSSRRLRPLSSAAGQRGASAPAWRVGHESGPLGELPRTGRGLCRESVPLWYLGSCVGSGAEGGSGVVGGHAGLSPPAGWLTKLAASRTCSPHPFEQLAGRSVQGPGPGWVLFGVAFGFSSNRDAECGLCCELDASAVHRTPSPSRTSFLPTHSGSPGSLPPRGVHPRVHGSVLSPGRAQVSATRPESEGTSLPSTRRVFLKAKRYQRVLQLMR